MNCKYFLTLSLDTRCINDSFSQQLKSLMKSNWSYSTAFFRGETKFASRFAERVAKATGLTDANGGLYQITSYPQGVGEQSV